MNVHVKSVKESLQTYYSAHGERVYDMVRTFKAYEPINSPSSLNSRLLLEDVPMGLVPMAEFAKLVGVDVPMMNLIIDLASQLLDKDFRKEGRTFENLGVLDMNTDELFRYIN